jgi:hypothetical protein
MSALVEAQAEDVSGKAAAALVARLADLLGDTEAGHFDVMLDARARRGPGEGDGGARRAGDG